MKNNRFLELVQYYFDSQGRRKKRFEQKIEQYKHMSDIDLEFEFSQKQNKYRFHDEISKYFKGGIAISFFVLVIGAVIRVSTALYKTFPKIGDVTQEQIRFAIGTGIAFVILIFAFVILIYFFYRKYVNNLRTDLDNIRNFIAERKGKEEYDAK